MFILPIHCVTLSEKSTTYIEFASMKSVQSVAVRHSSCERLCQPPWLYRRAFQFLQIKNHKSQIKNGYPPPRTPNGSCAETLLHPRPFCNQQFEIILPPNLHPSSGTSGYQTYGAPLRSLPTRKPHFEYHVISCSCESGELEASGHVGGYGTGKPYK